MSTNQYRVVSVKKSKAPEGLEGTNWHCYVIQRGTTVLTGQKPGTLRVVTEHAEQVARDLNARSGGASASLYAARRGR